MATPRIIAMHTNKGRTIAQTREVFQQYKDSGYSKKFLAEHRQEIETHRAAKRAFNELELKKLPSKKTLDAEYSQVLAEKKSLYAAYCEEQRKLKELLVHRENLRPYLAPQGQQTQKRAGRALIVLREAPKVRCHIALRYVFGAWGRFPPTSKAGTRRLPDSRGCKSLYKHLPCLPLPFV